MGCAGRAGHDFLEIITKSKAWMARPGPIMTMPMSPDQKPPVQALRACDRA
jgi:hypothetical protein